LKWKSSNNDFAEPQPSPDDDDEIATPGATIPNKQLNVPIVMVPVADIVNVPGNPAIEPVTIPVTPNAVPPMSVGDVPVNTPAVTVPVNVFPAIPNHAGLPIIVPTNAPFNSVLTVTNVTNAELFSSIYQSSPCGVPIKRFLTPIKSDDNSIQRWDIYNRHGI